MSSFLKAVLLIIIVAAVAVGLWWITRPPPLIIQGEVSADRYDISARASGRVETIAVELGDSVATGDLVVRLASPELQAREETDQAAVEVAKADYQRVIEVREEDIAIAEADVFAAQADLDLKERELQRAQELRKTNVTSQETLDIAIRDRDASVRGVAATKARLVRTTTGATQAERDLAQQRIDQAQAALEATRTMIEELTVVSPVDGLVTAKIAEVGENFSAGAPLISLIDMENLWFTFNIREDFLNGVEIGQSYQVQVPALNNLMVDVEVTVINVLGQFATWRATRATGDFDLRTFEVRAEPTGKVDGLRPGMSAIVQLPSTE
ncbi:HlyD family secretion protein [Palleronia caenipelagi]|uniref:HlyD family efflux transporter periplasmic adaptor subunit n=1 Tax=Palleronia caenipelagi TaxID=2489174 RepID=A0A547QAE5_9RHOB|nr:HlyD family secretion protein [Palleronia caenipelagi]TRD23296.1 HlyD family efflux transporter periplasmic adaptor subunit [Palleronia caenipelagi]